MQPDLGAAYVDGVAINHTGFACDVGVGMGWEREEDYGECEGEAGHNGPKSTPQSLFTPFNHYRSLKIDFFFSSESASVIKPSSSISLYFFNSDLTSTVSNLGAEPFLGCDFFLSGCNMKYLPFPAKSIS